MGKRRTRKEKEQAKHTFYISWTPASQQGGHKSKKAALEADVKRQFETPSGLKSDKASKPDLANLLAKEANLHQIKREMTKSLILAGVIVALETVLYLAWNVR